MAGRRYRGMSEYLCEALGLDGHESGLRCYCEVWCGYSPHGRWAVGDTSGSDACIAPIGWTCVGVPCAQMSPWHARSLNVRVRDNDARER